MKSLNRIALVIAVATLFSACGLAVSVEERVERAEEQAENGNYRTASIEFKNALSSNPDNARARLGLARVLLGLGEVLDAEKELRRAAELGTPGSIVRPLHMKVLLAREDYAEVLAALGQDESDLTDTQVAEFRGAALFGLGSFPAAEETYRQWLAAAPGNATAAVGLARVLAVTGRQEAAIEMLGALLEKDSGYADAWSVLGSIHFSLGDYETAAGAFARSLENRSLEAEFRTYVSTAIMLADVEFRAQRIDNARDAIAHVTEIAPSAIPTLLLNARLAQFDRDYSLAARYLQTVLAQDPNDLRALMFLADVQMRQDNLAQAAELLNRVVSLAPDNIQARKLLARVQLRQSDPSAIVEALAPVLDSGDPDVFNLVGQAHLQSGDVAAAIESFRTAALANPDGISEQINLAVSYLVAGNTEFAIEQLLSLPQGQDSEYRREQLLIMAYAQDGQMDAAAAVADWLATHRSTDPAAMNVAGRFRLATREFGDARTAFGMSLNVDPANVEAMIGIARLELAEENFDQSRANFEKVRALEPAHPVATLGLARLAYLEGDSDAAYLLLREASEANPSDVRLPLALAQLYLRDEMSEAALNAARTAATIGSRIASENAAIGKVLLESGALEEAVVSYEIAVKLAPMSAPVQMAMGYAYLSVDRSVDAQAALARAVELDNDLIPAAAALILVELRQGRYNSALQRVLEMRERVPNDVAMMLLEGEVYTAREEHVNAANAYRLAAENGAGVRAVLREYQSRRLGGLAAAERPLVMWLGNNPDDVRVRRYLADHYLVAGETSLATREYEQLLESEPDNEEVLNNLAWQYRLSGDLQGARALAEKAWELKPESGSIADTLGWIHRDLGETGRSLELLRQAVTLSPNNGEIQFHLAVVLSESGESDEARELLRALLSRDIQYPSKEAAARLLSNLSSEE